MQQFSSLRAIQLWFITTLWGLPEERYSIVMRWTWTLELRLIRRWDIIYTDYWANAGSLSDSADNTSKLFSF